MTEKKRNMKRLPPAITGRVPKQYPWLSEDRFCDVCVVGGGLTGALCALAAAESGLETVLITADCVGWGGTAYSPRAAEADGGRALTDLDRVMEMSDAFRLYGLERQALDDLQNLCDRLDGEFRAEGIASGFTRRDSLLFTADPADGELLEAEYLARRRVFPECALLRRRTASDAFSFDIHAGILTREGGAALDPYALTHLCLMKAERLGASVFEHTSAEELLPPEKEGSVVIQTSTRRTIYAERVILATGSDGMADLPFRAATRREYALIRCPERREHSLGWTGQCLLRGFGDGILSCVMPGGSVSAAISVPKGRLSLPLPFRRGISDHAAYSRLSGHLETLLDGQGDTLTLCRYQREWISPPDGLPVAGTHKDYRGLIFALCAGRSLPTDAMMTASAALSALSGGEGEPYSLLTPGRLF